MRKCIKVGLCLILVLGSIFCLCACGSESVADTPIKQTALGRFDIQTIIWEDGTQLSGDLLEEQIDIMGDTFVELYDDNTALLCIYGLRTDMEYTEGKMWRPDNGLYTYEFSVKDGKVSLEQDGTTFVFAKK